VVVERREVEGEAERGRGRAHTVTRGGAVPAWASVHQSNPAL